MRTISLNTFNGGMTNDPRDPAESVCRATAMFDNYSRPHKLSPHRDMVKDATTESTLDTYRIKKFLEAGGKLYAVGTDTSTNVKTQIYAKTSSFPTDQWTTAEGTSSSGSSTESTNSLMFVAHNNYLYGAGSGGVWKYGDITSGGSETFTASDYATHTPTGQGVVHSKDNILYFPSTNLVIAENSGAYNIVLTFSSGSVINSLCEDGNYLSIAVDNLDGTSTVYRWDRDATLATLPEVIQWGTGSLVLIENIGGVLCGISKTRATSSAITAVSDSNISFKYWTGSRVAIFQKFSSKGGLITSVGSIKQRFNDLFYFNCRVTLNGTGYAGVGKIYKDEVGRLAVSFDRLARNDDSDVTATPPIGFYRWGDYMFISYQIASNSKYTVWRTNDQSSFTATSIYETTINPEQPEKMRGAAGIRSRQKQLVAVALGVEPLTSGQQAVLKYRVDGGSWATIFSETTVGKTVIERVLNATGVKLQNGREYEFRIESTGGAEITELKYKVEELESMI